MFSHPGWQDGAICRALSATSHLSLKHLEYLAWLQDASKSYKEQIMKSGVSISEMISKINRKFYIGQRVTNDRCS